MWGVLRLPCIQKQTQTALKTWAAEENKPLKIHKHESGRKHLLDCWRTVSEVRMIWRIFKVLSNPNHSGFCDSKG